MTTRKADPAELDHLETASRDELVAEQLKRLRWSLGHAYQNVPFYKQSFDRHGVHPDQLESLEDLARFPFTVKDDLRRNYPFGMFAVPMEDVVRIHASSGTTGKPTVVGYTQNDIDMWATVMARSIRAAGGTKGDIVQVVYGYGLFTGGLGAHYGAERLGATVIPMSGGQTEKQVQFIVDFKPTLIMVTPSYCLNIADEFERQGLDPRVSSLQVGMFGAEPWTPAMRTEIEERLGHGRGRYLRAVRGDRARCVAGMHRNQGRAHHLGGPFFSGNHPLRKAARYCRTAKPANWSSPR